jgi:hypothetical protein
MTHYTTTGWRVGTDYSDSVLDRVELEHSGSAFAAIARAAIARLLGLTVDRVRRQLPADAATPLAAFWMIAATACGCDT